VCPQRTTLGRSGAATRRRSSAAHPGGGFTRGYTAPDNPITTSCPNRVAQAETVRPYRFENHDATVFASQVSTDYLHMVDFWLERAHRGFLSRRSIESVEDGAPTGDSSIATGDARRRASSAGVAPDRTGPSVCYVVHDQGSGEIHFDRDTVEGLLARGNFFWLDLDQPSEGDFQILRDVFKFHPLAIEDSEHFDQRAKLDDYDDFVFVVVYGAAPDDDRLVEVHCFYSERFLITVHRDDCPAFAEIRRRYRQREQKIEQPSLLLYRVVDGLVDSFFPVLAALDDRIDELEDAIFLKADDKQLQEIFQMKRLLVGLRKAVSPQRDTFARLMGGIAQLPGLAEEDERYFRDIYDHLIRISDLIDSYRDLLTGAMDVYLSTVSNRLNSVMKQLTIIATIFLPLSWLTGFFGQNFGFMVRHIGRWETFIGLGFGSELLVLAALLLFFKRRSWF
jgi:magnesium transporter